MVCLHEKKFLLVMFLLIFLASFSITSQIYLNQDDARNIYIVGNMMGPRNWLDSFSPYQGLNFLLIPFFQIFGYTMFAFRFAQSFILALTALLTFMFLKEFYDRRTAIVSVLVLSSLTYFLSSCWSEVPFLPFYAIILMHLGLRYHRTGEKRYFYALSFLLGWSIYLKITIVYVTIALVFSYLLASRLLGKRKFRFPGKRILAAGFLLFLIGLSPLVYVNLTSDNPDRLLLPKITGNLLKTESGYNNFDFVSNVGMRASQLVGVFSMNAWYDYINNNAILPYVFLFSLIMLIFYGNMKDRFLASFVLFFTLLLSFTISESHPIHFFLLFPVFAAIFSRAGLRLSRKSLMATLVLFVVLFGSNASELSKTYAFAGNQTMFEEHWSQNARVISEPTFYFIENNITPELVVFGTIQPSYVFDAYEHNSYLNTGYERVIPCGVEYVHGERFNSTTNCSDAGELYAEAFTHDSYYVFASTERSKDDRYIYDIFCPNEESYCDVPMEVFLKTLDEEKRTAVIVHTINDSLGKPVYDIYRVL